ncbi:MAG: phosphatidate cytidylyltransferase [Oscillospiraceae bacterium]|nr:phosphatidate cytidylyltransferase [Oscillospiraceae bacterium]
MTAFIGGFGILAGYFIVCASAALFARRLIRIPTEVFRKILHTILLCSLFVWLYAFPNWWMASLAALLFIAIAYPLLSFGEKWSGYSALLTERKGGEIKNSLFLVFTMFAILNALCWGLLGQRWLVLACICAWGFGDAAAALIGKKYGKHYLEGKYIEGRKSVEGTFAMFTVSFLSVLIVLMLFGPLPWYGSLLIAFVTAAVSAVVELFTRRGMDTVTCPFAAAAVLLPLLILWSAWI